MISLHIIFNVKHAMPGKRKINNDTLLMDMSDTAVAVWWIKILKKVFAVLQSDCCAALSSTVLGVTALPPLPPDGGPPPKQTPAGRRLSSTEAGAWRTKQAPWRKTHWGTRTNS